MHPFAHHIIERIRLLAVLRASRPDVREPFVRIYRGSQERFVVVVQATCHYRFDRMTVDTRRNSDAPPDRDGRMSLVRSDRHSTHSKTYRILASPSYKVSAACAPHHARIGYRHTHRRPANTLYGWTMANVAAAGTRVVVVGPMDR